MPADRASPPRIQTDESAMQVAAAVYAEQVATVFRQMPIALGVNLVNAGLVATVLSPLANRSEPALWFSLVALITFGRAVLWWRFRCRHGRMDWRWWSRSAAVGAFLGGLAWGCGGVTMLGLVPPAAQSFLTIVVGGMCAGAAVVSAPHLPSLLAFLIPASLPMAGHFLVEVTPVDRALGAMILVFAAAMALAGMQLNRSLGSATRLRLVLDETNHQLQHEIAKHQATEAALRQAQKLEAIGHLTGGIAHDFSNLLTIIIGNLAMAKDRLDPNSAVAPLIDSATQAAERGVRLIQRLLGFARRQRLAAVRVDVGRLVSNMQEMLSRTLGPQIHLLFDIAGDLAPVEIDPNHLELAILNLAINARDAMPEGGTLRIAVCAPPSDANVPIELAHGDYVVLEIADTGDGMDEATLAQAFEPFFTTKEPGAGTGLGLPTVLGFLTQSGGAIRLLSRVGSGTTAQLWLPRAKSVTNETPTHSRFNKFSL